MVVLRVHGLFALAMASGEGSAAQHGDGIAIDQVTREALVDAPELRTRIISFVRKHTWRDHGKRGTVCEGAHVTLILKLSNAAIAGHPGLAPSQEAISEASGRFTFFRCAAGSISITVTPPGSRLKPYRRRLLRAGVRS